MLRRLQGWVPRYAGPSFGGPFGGGGISAPGLGQRRPEPEPVCPPPAGKSGISASGSPVRPGVPDWGSGLESPHPPVWTPILGPANLPKSAQKRAEFLRFFGACGATSRGGGGAPPTTLILLRNQRQPAASRRRHRAPRRTRDRPASASPEPPNMPKKELLFALQ